MGFIEFDVRNYECIWCVLKEIGSKCVCYVLFFDLVMFSIYLSRIKNIKNCFIYIFKLCLELLNDIRF